MGEKAVLVIIVGCSVLFLFGVVSGNVKLTGGIETKSFYYGVLQVNHSNVWGTVCDDGWITNNTKVVCRQLGYQQGKKKHTGGGSGQKWLDDVRCTGSESSIVNCKHRGWGVTDCSHSEDVFIVCYSPGGSPNLAFRLADKLADYLGRLEVRYHGTWGALCPDNIGVKEGHVICRMLGYSRALAIYNQPTRSVNSMRFSLILKCLGNETSTEECSTMLNTDNLNTCGINGELWIFCKPISVPNVAVRLVNGSTLNQGRVEVRYYGVWGTVCDDYWELKDARVVCRMLNYSKASWAGTAKVSGSGPILLDDLKCRGNEMSLGYCRANDWGQHNCRHREDAGAKCEYVTKEDLLVTARLVETKQKNTGFVEVHYNGTWIPVCDDTWDILDAHVICRMLGYKAALAPMRQSRRGMNGLWMGGVECSGDEVSISECSYRGWTNTQCHGNYYAGVMCKVLGDLPPVEVRLERGRTPDSGRVAVRYGNVWGSICISGLDINAAKVICRMFGYPRAIYMYTSRFVNVTIWLSKLECNGTENSIVDCRHPGWGETTSCSHSNDVGVKCKEADAPRFIINGTNALTDSTVEILFNNSQRLISDYRLKSFYQVAVEKRDNEQRFKSYEQATLFIYSEVNATIATKMGNDSYITAEILGPISNLTIGNGQYYHGYYNAPLEPGSMYRVHVRIVTMAMDGKRINGQSSFVAFTTKSFMVSKAKTPRKEVQSGQVVTGLSAAMIALICVTIGLNSYYRLKLKKTKEKCKTTRMSEMTEITCPGEPNGKHEAHYQPLHITSEAPEEGSNYENIMKISKALPDTERQVEEDLYENY